MTQLARLAVLVLGGQSQFHGGAQPRLEVDLPIAQLQTPVQAHALLVLGAFQ
ncbi:hypothetical protein D3C86_1813520 [compost metagenome]